jgi:CheY-like chemotaxis protein
MAQKKRILVVDDDPDILDVTKCILQGSGYEVWTCDNGRQALAYVAMFQPDLILLDVMLPGIDGYSLQIKLAEETATKGVPVIVITGLGQSKTFFQKFPQVAAFMTKPWEVPSLLRNIETALAGRLQPA